MDLEGARIPPFVHVYMHVARSGIFPYLAMLTTMTSPSWDSRVLPSVLPERGMAVELTEEQVEAQQALVRGQLAKHYQELWEYAQDHMDEDGRADPRFAELGLRTLDRIAKLYRLTDAPQVKPEEELFPEQSRERVRALVLGQLEELESRQRGVEPARVMVRGQE